MPKRVLQDVVRRPVTKIIKPKEEETFFNERNKKILESDDGLCDLEIDQIKEDKKGSNSSNNNIWFLAVVCIVFLFFGIFSLFTKATIVISPKIENVEFDEKLIFYKKGENISFEVGMMSGDEVKNVSIENTEYKEEKANGIVNIFNENTTSQRFAIGTKLLGSNGKIYKITEPVNIPGITKSGTEIIPGSVEVKIEAEEVGGDYNSEPIDFEIISLKGTSKASKFKVLSLGDITGGVKGEVSVLPDDKQTEFFFEMRNSLKNKLFSQIKNQIPEGSIMFEDSLVFNINREEVVFSEENNIFTLTLQGSAYGVLFDKEKLTKELAKRSIEDFSEEDIYINNLASLVFGYNDTFDESELFNATVLNFSLSGPIEFVYRVNELDLVPILVSRHKKEFINIMNNFSNISSAELTLRPPWNRYLPKDTKDFELIVNYPEI